MTIVRPDRILWGIPVLLGLWGGALTVAMPRIEADLRARIFAERGVADSDALTRSGARVQVDGRDVSVLTDTGLALDVEAAVAGALRSVAGVRRVAVVTPPPVALDPFTFTARLRGGVLRLTGGVPSAAIHAELIDAARRVVPPGGLDDRLRLATGAPEGFGAAAEALLDVVGQFEAGEVSLTGRVFSASGEAKSFAAYNAARDALAAPLRGFAPADTAVLPPVASPFGWSAERMGDVLTLSGNVPTEASRSASVAAARAALPGGSVIDRTQTARGLDPAVPFDAVAGASLEALGRLQSGSAALSGKALRFDGASPARDLLGSIGEDLRRSLPASVSPERIELRAVPADPFRATVTRRDGRVTVEGFLPDPPARTRLLALLARRFPAEAVVDRTHLADGAPPDFAAVAERGVDELAEFADGTLALSGRTARLAGRVLYRELATRLASRWPGAVPAGWTATAEIDGPPPERALDRLQCEDLLADAAKRQPLRFEPGQTALGAAGRSALDALLAVARRCPPLAIRLVLPTRPGPEGEDAESRARLAALTAASEGAGLPPGVRIVTGTETAAPGAATDRVDVRVEP